jgi:uncharacterized protein YjdB/N-acetylmuramoyl-L-alanine amidase
MLKRRLLAITLSTLLVVNPVLSPIASYAETVSEQEAVAETLAQLDESSSEEDSDAAASVTDDAAESAGASAADDGSAESTDAATAVMAEEGETEASLDNLEYVYIDDQIVSLGEDNYIAVGFAESVGNVTSAKLYLTDSNGKSYTLDATAVDGTGALFTANFSGEDQTLNYTLTKLVYSVDGAEERYFVDFSKDESSENDYSFDVVTAETSEALSGDSEDGVTAMYADENGNFQAADSVEEAIELADSEGVAESNDAEDGIAVASLDDEVSAASVDSSTRENYLIVAIDAGHGGSDGGAEGNGVVEANANWSIANALKNELDTYAGVTTYMVRYSTSDNPSVQERVDRAHNIGADVLVSVHNNSAGESAHGFEILVPNNTSYNSTARDEAKALASKIETQLKSLGLYDRGFVVKDYPSGYDSSTYSDGSTADYYGIVRYARKYNMPGIIVEHAFVTNSSDAAKLKDSTWLNKLGVADATGVAQQYNLGKESAAKASASVAVKAHVADLGWEKAVYDGKVSGTTGKGKGMEAFTLSLMNGAASSGSVTYRANVGGTWQGWVSSGQTAGTTGKGTAMQAVQIKLTGDAANKYDIYYRVHSAEVGWLGWAKNGESAGTSGYGYDMQAIEVVLVAKGSSAPGSTNGAYKVKGETTMSLSYRAHVSDVGWQSYVGESQTAGTTGQSHAIEALQFSLADAKYSGDIQCSAHVQDYGWQDYVSSGTISGTTGKSKRLEAIKIKLTGELANQYDVYYRVHSQDYGWLGWAKNGEAAGTKGYSKRAEAIEVRLVKKGEAAPGSTDGAFVSKDDVPMTLTYRAHVSDVGWQSYVSAGQAAGTTGQSHAIEALQLSLANAKYSGDIQCQAHVQDIGWQSYASSGSISGTTGMSKRLEAVRIKLTGELANHYDVYYRVHSQDYGWLGWAKNGEAAGTEGLSKRAEAIEIRLVEKGGAAPGTTSGAYIVKTSASASSSSSTSTTSNKTGELIMGASQKTASQMAALYKKLGKSFPSSVYSSRGASTIDEFCQILYEEATTEGVRAEVVFAQAMYETGWLQFGGSVKAEQCNFAGMGAVDSSAGGATFDNVRTGLRAQVQHLKAYASTEALKNACVDPRFKYVTRGVASDLADLNGRWAVPGTTYGQSIKSIMDMI